VRNGNPYSESFFLNLKCRLEPPDRPFEKLLQARSWAARLVRWYNEEHRHSAIGFVTPNQRHAEQDPALLENRAVVYERARQANPQRWSKQTCDWICIGRVDLNPETTNRKEAEADKEAA